MNKVGCDRNNMIRNYSVQDRGMRVEVGWILELELKYITEDTYYVL